MNIHEDQSEEMHKEESDLRYNAYQIDNNSSSESQEELPIQYQ